MRLSYYLRRALTTPPHRTVLKAAHLAARRRATMRQRRRDRLEPTYSDTQAATLHRFVSPVGIDLLRPRAEEIAALAERYLTHEFDLLGSGWVQVKHGIRCRGLEGYQYDSSPPVEADSEGQWLTGRINQANLPEVQRIWRLVDGGYIPIDWHLDFKSGYRWSESTWSQDILYGHKLGADVKVPWELSRCQHLPQLAFAYALAKDGHPDFESPDRYVHEFRNQVLDIMATNPPRYGVNWKCTMDVAIRAANWLLAHDLFRASGAEFDSEFKTLFSRSVYEHGHHIVNHLEWNSQLRGNHYLADIVGLLFVAAYLPRSPETDTWLALAVQELVREVGCQFNQDGSSFEASTSYHRLSAEMVVYATALILGLPDDKLAALSTYEDVLALIDPKLAPAPLPAYPLPGQDRRTPFPPDYLERLERMAEFSMHITKPDGQVVQVGDNDNGRFFKFHPVFREQAMEDLSEDFLDHRHLVAAINGLFDREDFAGFTGEGGIDQSLVTALSGGTKINPSPRHKHTARVASSKDRGLRAGLQTYAYPEFGLYIYRSNRLYLAIHCGPNGQNGFGGHAHNDKLSFELAVDGVPILIDPGTYLYTPLPDQRNHFRSTAMHNTLAITGLEQNRWDITTGGLFKLYEDAMAKVERFDDERFVGVHRGFGHPHRRILTVANNRITGCDTCVCEGRKKVVFHLAPGVVPRHEMDQHIIELVHNRFRLLFNCKAVKPEVVSSHVSRGYGILEGGTIIYVPMLGEQLGWTVEVSCRDR